MTGNALRARIKVISRIDAGDGRPDMIRREYVGTCAELEGGFVLEYDEPDMTAHVALSCRAGCALLERTGEAQSRMEFAPGQTRPALYALPEGEFDLATECGALSVERTAAHGRLRISYRLLSAGAPVSDNRLAVTYWIC